LNAGTFRCFDVLVRENCVVGIPRHPASCSNATGGPSLTIQGMGLAALAERTGAIGGAYSAVGSGPSVSVVSGIDGRTGAPFVTQIFAGSAGGPATEVCDGWVTFLALPAGGLQYLDSVEIIEQKYPLYMKNVRVRVDSEGAGRRRGAPGCAAEYGTLGKNPVRVHYYIIGFKMIAEGVCGGGPAAKPSAYFVAGNGIVEERPQAVCAVDLDKGQFIGSRTSGGGGFGDPFTREADRVLFDVREGYVSVGRARTHYGVAIAGDAAKPETLMVDETATQTLRAARA
jgi:N-methylhydantoinase B